MPKVKIKLPPGALDLPDLHKAELVQALGRQLGLNMNVTTSQHTTHDPERSMWTPDAVPIVAELEDWFYGNLAGPTWQITNDVIGALDLPEDPAPAEELEKALGEEFSGWRAQARWLSKADGDGFSLGDIIRMNRDNRRKLFQYVADGGTYSREELLRLQQYISTRTPDFGPLLEAYAVRSVLLGKLTAAAHRENLTLLSVLLSQLPVRLEQVRRDSTWFTLQSKGGLEQELEVPPLTPAEVEAVQYAEQHAAQYVTRASDSLRHEIQGIVTHARRNRIGSQELKQKLLDNLGEANRDWRKIALTELTDAMANGYLASLPDGARVMGQGAANACPHCKRLVIGRKFTKQSMPGDPVTTVWVGKSNVGRRAAEYWPTIPMHPHCRCRWVQLADFQDVDDQGNVFILPLEQLIEIYKRKGLIHPEYTMDDGAPGRTTETE